MTSPTPGQRDLLRAELRERALREKDILALSVLDLTDSMNELESHLTINESQTKRNRVNNLVNSVLIFVVISAVVVMGVLISSIRKVSNDDKALINHEKEFTSCVASWAQAETDWTEATSIRSEALSKARKPQDDALHAIIVSLTKPNFQEKFPALISAYLVAYDEYNKSVSNFPVPAAPVFQCH